LKITVCELPDAIEAAGAAWDELEHHLQDHATDLLVLPELPAVGSFWTQREFDLAVWEDAVARHAALASHLERLDAKRIIGTRAVQSDGQRLNESFLWTKQRGLVPGRAKAWLPNEEEGWEAAWFDRGNQKIDPVIDDGLRFATLICTELLVSPAPRALGQAGIQLIAVPRATGGHARWDTGARMAAISAGAFVATANRRGIGFTGGSWVIGPDGDRLAATDAANPIVTVTVDLAAADVAKQTYPRNVED